MRFKYRVGDTPEQEINVRWAPVALDWAWGQWQGTRWRTVAFALLLLLSGMFAGTQINGCHLPLPSFECTPRPDPVPPVPPKPKGFTKALLVYKVQEDAKTPQVWFDPEIQAYMKARCAQDFRAVDPDIDVSKGPKWAQDGMAAYKTSGIPPPALVVGSGDKWGAVPFPDSPAQALALLKKLGG